MAASAQELTEAQAKVLKRAKAPITKIKQRLTTIKKNITKLDTALAKKAMGKGKGKGRGKGKGGHLHRLQHSVYHSCAVHPCFM